MPDRNAGHVDFYLSDGKDAVEDQVRRGTRFYDGILGASAGQG